uniref:Aldedh domain-containing protein n=1 Tax=Panagrellus redivivus TaxID=6233 RepID=A0A7E4VZG0_PANRE
MKDINAATTAICIRCISALRSLCLTMASQFHAIVENQRKFFKTGATIPLDGRKSALEKIKEIVGEHSDAFAEAIHKDLKREKEYTKAVELGAIIAEIDYFLANLSEWAKHAPVSTEGSPVDPDATAFIVKDPQGVVLLISPWNYPAVLCFWPLVPIIAAGNTCIIKPSELAPATSQLIADLIAANFDPNFITVVQGGVPESTALLEERYDHIMYTGNPSVAKIIMKAAAVHLTPVTLELGGKSPVIVEPDADITKTAERLVANKWVNVGQTCITPDYVLTRDELKPKLAAAIEVELTKKYGDKPKESPLYSRIINERHFEECPSTSSLQKNTKRLRFRVAETQAAAKERLATARLRRGRTNVRAQAARGKRFECAPSEHLHSASYREGVNQPGTAHGCNLHSSGRA